MDREPADRRCRHRCCGVWRPRRLRRAAHGRVSARICSSWGLPKRLPSLAAEFFSFLALRIGHSSSVAQPPRARRVAVEARRARGLAARTSGIGRDVQGQSGASTRQAGCGCAPRRSDKGTAVGCDGRAVGLPRDIAREACAANGSDPGEWGKHANRMAGCNAVRVVLAAFFTTRGPRGGEAHPTVRPDRLFTCAETHQAIWPALGGTP